MKFLALDLGASSGRAILGEIQAGRLTLEEIHRFGNRMFPLGKHLHWNVLGLLEAVQHALAIVRERNEAVLSFGIDTWGVDYGLISQDGDLVHTPHAYRDPRTEGVAEKVFAQIPREEIYAITGNQSLAFNTIFQLVAAREAAPERLDAAERLLMTPELLTYFLTGEPVSEYTITSTSQLLDAQSRSWSTRLLERLGLPPRLFGPVSAPGTVVGPLLPELRDDAPPEIQAVLPATHDTASAVAATPGQGDWAYLSLGTWALLGIELATPILSKESMLANFTNEGGVNQTYRYLKNIAGLWLLQECRRVWSEEGRSLDYGELVAMAQTSPAFAAFIDPDDKAFQAPGNMPAAIAEYCVSTGQTPPSAVGAIARVIFEGIALKCRRVMDTLRELTGQTIRRLHLVGGGVRNRLLCQFLSNALDMPVFAGPVEATAAGNVLIQAVALGHLDSIKDAREIVRQSFEIATYEPRERDQWEQAYQTFTKLIASNDQE